MNNKDEMLFAVLAVNNGMQPMYIVAFVARWYMICS